MPRFSANIGFMFNEVPFVDRYAAAAQAGFRGIECPFPYEVPPDELAQLLPSHDVQQVLCNLPPDGMAAIPGQEEAFAAGLERALTYARALDCPRLHAMAGAPPAEMDRADCEAVYVQNLRWAAETLQPHGVRLLIEPINTTGMPGYFLHTAAQARRIMDQVGHANLFLQLDLYHCQIMTGNLSETIKTHLEVIDHFQIAGHPGRHEPDVGEIHYPYLFDLIDDTGITLFGTSAKFIDACRNAGVRPRATHDLSSLRTITSTGSTLVAEGFDWVYGNVKADVHLASISGGTDLCGCLVAGDPTSPVRRGEIQRPGLGMDTDVVDDSGRPLPCGVEGELVCRSPFPSMPLRFWDDGGDARYRAAYFERIAGVWHHGDFASRTPSGGFVISGRSDATLNPGGVRIGTAEIYRRVDTMPEVDESIAVGQPYGADTRVVLFVKMASGHELTDRLRDVIRSRIRAELSPRHVPAVIAAVDDIPRTRSGKMTETAVRDVICGRPVHNTSAMANPEALEHFRNRAELA